jgi:hypothetical protein
VSREQREDHDRDRDAALRRAQAAIDAAEQVRARSEIVVGASAALRERRMTSRCAWCSRYSLGGRWVLVIDAPTFVESANVTHGICEDCVRELRTAGLSA